MVEVESFINRFFQIICHCLQSTRNKGNVVESVTAHAVPIPYGNDVNIHSRLKDDL